MKQDTITYFLMPIPIYYLTLKVIVHAGHGMLALEEFLS